LTIHKTPIPGAPINFGYATGLTDLSGEVSLRLPSSGYISVSSGLPVISFTPLADFAINFSAQSPVIIEAERLVEPLANICQVLVGEEEHVFFPYENKTDNTMSVPLQYHLINRILSPRGEAIPPELFAPGLVGNGFSIPKRYFDTGAGLAGIWEFIGTRNSVPAQLNMCTDQGAPACELLPPASFDSVFNYPRALVIKLTNASIKLGKRGKWRAKGNYRGPFFSRGGRALAKIKEIMNSLAGDNYQCNSPQPQCRIIAVPKVELMKAFKIIYTGSVPGGLKSLKKTEKRETAAYQRIVNALPDTVTKCD
jgi:hypothetical protein